METTNDVAVKVDASGIFWMVMSDASRDNLTNVRGVLIEVDKVFPWDPYPEKPGHKFPSIQSITPVEKEGFGIDVTYRFIVKPAGLLKVSQLPAYFKYLYRLTRETAAKDPAGLHSIEGEIHFRSSGNHHFTPSAQRERKELAAAARS